jgi:hypothetical protein
MKHSKFKKKIAVSLVLAMFCACQAVASETNVGEKTGKVSAQGQAVSDWQLASQLAEYGEKGQDPLALLLAARIMKANTPKDVAIEKTGEAVAEDAAKSDVPTPAELLAQAKGLAGDNMQLVAMIDATAKQQGTRGDVTGPNKHRDRVEAGLTDSYKITFAGGEEARVVVIGDGDNDLDLFVYDENDNLVESDQDGSDKCLVIWTPKWTGEFTVKIKNLGSQVYSNYALLTN